MRFLQRAMLHPATALAALVVATVAVRAGTTHREIVRPLAGSSFSGVKASQAGWRFEGAAGTEKMASVPLYTPSFSLLLVEVQVGEASGAVDPLIVDLMGPGYDSPEQEFHLVLEQTASSQVFSRVLFTGLVPEPRETRLRFFEYSGAALSISRVSVRSVHVGLALAWLICAALLATAIARSTAGLFGVSLDRHTLVSAAEAIRTRALLILGDRDFLLPALVGLAVCVVVGRVIALPYPLLASDEFPYAFRSKFGWRPLPGEEGQLPVLPNLLYFSLFHWVHGFGADAMVAARALNTLLVALAAYPMYRLGRRFLEPVPAALVALIFCAGPTSSYAACFMPEATYFLCFWIAILAFVRVLERPTLARVATVALVLAALTLIKPHALVVVACLCAVLPVLRWFQPNGLPLRRLLILAGALGAFWYAFWFCLAFALAERAFFNPTGTVYGATAAGYVLSTHNVRAVGLAMALVAERHFGVLLTIFGVPALLLLWRLGEAAIRRDRAPSGLAVPFVVMSAAVLGALMLMTVKFTAQLVGADGTATIDRMHGRYYSFAFPLLVLGAAAARSGRAAARWHAGQVLVTAAILVAGFFMGSSTPIPYVVDFPEAFALTTSSPLFYTAVIANLSAAALCLTSPGWSWRVVLAWLLVFSLSGMNLVFEGQRDRNIGTDADRMGIAMREIVPVEERDSAVIFSRSVDVRSFYVGLHLLSRARMRSAGDLSGDHCSAVPGDPRFIVTLDPIPVACGFHPVVRIGEAQLYERSSGGGHVRMP